MSDIDTLVGSILRRSAPTPEFAGSQYPFMYATDFYMAHYQDFTGDLAPEDRDDHEANLGNRGAVLRFLRDYATRTGQNPAVVIITVADAALTEEDITEAGITVDKWRLSALLVVSLREKFNSYLLPDPDKDFAAWRSAAVQVFENFGYATWMLPTD